MKLTPYTPLALALASLTLAGVARADSYSLETLDLSSIEQGWGEAHAGKSVDGHGLSIGRQKFAHGIGTHATSTFRIDLGGKAEQFTASVGVDDEVGQRGSVVFRLTGDGKTLWDSGLMRGGMPAKPVAVDLHGVKKLTLTVEDGGDGMDFDHADWADAQIAMAEGKPAVLTPPREEPVVLTPKASPKARINGARIVGVRPGSPFQFTIAASGESAGVVFGQPPARRSPTGPDHRHHHRLAPGERHPRRHSPRQE